jgi:hypothetical protein
MAFVKTSILKNLNPIMREGCITVHFFRVGFKAILSLSFISMIVVQDLEPHPSLWRFPSRHQLKLSNCLFRKNFQSVNNDPSLFRLFSDSTDLLK